jgi:hypothetical protein
MRILATCNEEPPPNLPEVRKLPPKRADATCSRLNTLLANNAAWQPESSPVFTCLVGVERMRNLEFNRIKGDSDEKTGAIRNERQSGRAFGGEGLFALGPFATREDALASQGDGHEHWQAIADNDRLSPVGLDDVGRRPRRRTPDVAALNRYVSSSPANDVRTFRQRTPGFRNAG